MYTQRKRRRAHRLSPQKRLARRGGKTPLKEGGKQQQQERLALNAIVLNCRD